MTPIVSINRAGTVPVESACSRQTRSVCTTCTVMSGNGAMMPPRGEFLPVASSTAAAGTTPLLIAGRRTSNNPPNPGPITTSAFAWHGCGHRNTACDLMFVLRDEFPLRFAIYRRESHCLESGPCKQAGRVRFRHFSTRKIDASGFAPIRYC